MNDRKILNAYINPVAQEIVSITSSENEDQFFKQSETNLLSLLIIYTDMNSNTTQNKELIKELKKLLDDINTFQDLKQLSESISDNSDIKEIWKNDAFFYTSKGWEFQDNKVKQMTLLGVKKRIDYLYSRF